MMKIADVLGFAVVVAFLSIPAASGSTTYTVDDDWAGADHDTVQDAINASISGDIVRVFEGKYDEDISINVSIQLIGNGSMKTQLNGTGTSNVIEVSTDNVVVSGIMISGMTSGDSGLNTNAGADSLIVDNCSFIGNGDKGIDCSSDIDSPLIDNCSFEGTDCGIKLSQVNYAEVKNCEFIDNHDGGIWLSSTDNHDIRWCNFTRCGFQFSGVYEEDYDSHIIENCTVNGKPVYYYANEDQVTVPTSAGQVIMASTTDSLIQNQSLEQCTSGIELGFCDNIVIENSSIGNMQMAIGINRCSQTFIRHSELFNTTQDNILIVISEVLTVENCTFWTDMTSFRTGIAASGTPRITVNNTRFSGFRGAGVFTGYNRLMIRDCQFNHSAIGLKISGGMNHVIEGNTFFENEKGINLAYCSHVTITNNTIRNGTGTSFTGYGIYLSWDPSHINISYNEIYDNSNYGIYIDSADQYTIHHNNFIDNGGTSSQAYDKDGDGTWDDGVSEGNYWSDWGGTGNYSIDGDAKSWDEYPLGDPIETSAPEKIPESALFLNAAFVSIVMIAALRRHRRR